MTSILAPDIWSVIGAIATTLALIVTLFLEWPRIRERVSENSKLVNKIRFIALSTIICTVAGFLGTVFAFILNAYVFLPFHNDFVSSTQMLAYFQEVPRFFDFQYWSIGGVILGLLLPNYQAKPVHLHSSEAIFTSIIGMLLGIAVGFIGLIVIYFSNGIAFTTSIDDIGWIICTISGTGFSGIVVGFFARKLIASLMSQIYKNESV